MLGLELSEELVEIVNVPRPLDLGQHDDVELVTRRGDDLAHVVEHPGAVQAVDARPKPGRAEVGLARHGDEPGTRRFLLIRGDGVLEIAEHDVDLSRDVLDLGAYFLVVRRYEVDHALEPYRQRAIRLGGADGERGIELGRRAAAGHRVELLLRRGALYWAAGT